MNGAVRPAPEAQVREREAGLFVRALGRLRSKRSRRGSLEGRQSRGNLRACAADARGGVRVGRERIEGAEHASKPREGDRNIRADVHFDAGIGRSAEQTSELQSLR